MNWDQNRCINWVKIIVFKCLNIEGKGFNMGSYECKCRPGYYRPKNTTKMTRFQIYDEYSCLKCSEGCDTCEGYFASPSCISIFDPINFVLSQLDDRPCRKPVPESFKRIALITNLICILICLILVILTWYHMTLKVNSWDTLLLGHLKSSWFFYRFSKLPVPKCSL